MSVRPWSNQDLELFHGTTISAAQNVVESGVDVNRSRPDCDFGRGFYCTTAEKQAARWAKNKAVTTGQSAAIVRFSVPRIQIANLSSLSFVRGERDALDFWSLIHFFRDGKAQSLGIDIAVLFPYDVVFGPIALWKSRQPMQRSDQVSFHTQVAQNMLNLISNRSIITI